MALLAEQAAWSTSAYNVILPHALLVWALLVPRSWAAILLALACSIRGELVMFALLRGWPGLAGLVGPLWLWKLGAPRPHRPMAGLPSSESPAQFARAAPRRPAWRASASCDRPAGAVPKRAIEDRAIEDRAIEDRAIEDRAIEDRAIEDRAIEDRAIEDIVAALRWTTLLSGNPCQAEPLREQARTAADLPCKRRGVAWA